MSGQARVRANAYLLLHRATGSKLGSYYREFLRQDRERSYPEPGALLAQTLEHAAATVPHYRGLVSPQQIKVDPFAALTRFPLLSRDVVRERWPKMLSERGERSKWVENTSGGSTGEPVKLLQDPEHLALTVAAREVYSTWTGSSLGDPELYIWGSEKDLEGDEAWRKRFGNWVLRRSLLNAFMLTDKKIETVLECLQEGPPRLVIAYGQAGYEVARFASRKGVTVPPQRAMIATAETVYDFMREQLEGTFGCPVFNRYGSRETGDIAGECEHRMGMHVLPWNCHVEVLGDDRQPVGPGEEGEIAVTGFTNRAMPLIRYLIGDRARLPQQEVSCPCGRRTQMLAEVTGRTIDMFFAPDGTMVDSGYFSTLMFYRPWLRQFQVVQRAPDDVLFRVSCEAEVPPADREEIVAKTKAVLGEECKVAFEALEAIEPSPSGKLRFTIREF